MSLETHTGETIDYEWVKRNYSLEENLYLHSFIRELLAEIDRLNDAAWEIGMGEDA